MISWEFYILSFEHIWPPPLSPLDQPTLFPSFQKNPSLFFVYFWNYNWTTQYFSPPFKYILLNQSPLDSCPLSWAIVILWLYVYIYIYVFFNIMCWVIIVLFVCMFSGLTLWCCTTNWCVLPWVGSPLLLPTLLSYL